MWVPVPNKPTVFVDVKQHSTKGSTYHSDLILLSNNDEQKKCVRLTSQLESSIVMRPFQADSLFGALVVELSTLQPFFITL